MQESCPRSTISTSVRARLPPYPGLQHPRRNHLRCMTVIRLRHFLGWSDGRENPGLIMCQFESTAWSPKEVEDPKYLERMVHQHKLKRLRGDLI